MKKAKSKAPKRAARSKSGKRKSGTQIAFLGLGSNMGDREEFIEQAVFLLSKTPGLRVLKRSTNYETEPQGEEEQPNFINAAIEVETTITPEKLLAVAQDVETALGREREMEWGPRSIDIDILLFGDRVISEDNLQIPHPLLHERLFALQPLKEIAPEVVHPILEKTIEELFEERSQTGNVKYDDALPGFKEIKRAGADDYEKW